MKRFIAGLMLSVATLGALAMPAVALEDGATPRGISQPTFTTVLDESEQSVGLWAGKSYILAGNNLADETDARTGLMLAAGNNLQLAGHSEYSFVFGNNIEFNGTTDRDLYTMGNVITLTPAAEIGRDVFAAASELYVQSDLSGDLSVTSGRVVFADNIIIDGNVNLDAGQIRFGNNVQINGKLVYNSTAEIVGLDKAKYNEVEVYQVEEISESAQFATAVYGKFLSIAGLFAAIALVLVLYPAAKAKPSEITSGAQLGKNCLWGLGFLVGVPVVALFALFTIVAMPVSIILIVVYAIAIYLAQGFAGLWLGNVILNKLFKIKSNAFVDALVGIVTLGLLGMIPVLGGLTGFVGLVIGLGIIAGYLRPRSDKTKALKDENKKAVATKRPAKK